MLNSLSTKILLFASLVLTVTACGTMPASDNTDTAGAGQTQSSGTNPNMTGGTTNPNATGNPNATTTDPNAKCADTWANYAKAFFNGNCVGCHPTFTDPAKVMADTMIQTQISSDAMPRGTTLAPADKTRILNWIDCKEPQ